MNEQPPDNPPSPFIAGWVRRAARAHPGGRALDVATGRGRHALALAHAGFHTTGIDIRVDALQAARTRALAEGVSLALVCADLEIFPLPLSRFDVVVVSRYLDRVRFRHFIEALVPGGILIVETFTEHQLRHARGPRSPAHLLKPGELRMLTRGVDVLFDEEVTGPDALARIAARRPLSRRSSAAA